MCSGKEYDAFGRRFQAYLNETRQLERTVAADSTDPTSRTGIVSKKRTRVNPNWGRRTFPFPSNTTVLIMGNSYTRQIGEELACQYRDQIVSHEKIVPTTVAELSKNHRVISNQTASYLSKFKRDDMGHYRKTVFSNGATLIHISNSYIVYTEDCCGENGLLEHVIGMPLSKVSAILLGKFNSNEDARIAFTRTVLLNKWEIDLEKSPPIELEQLASVYDGPIIAYSMFAEHANKFANETKETIRELQTGHATNDTITRGARNNLRFVDVRAHVDRFGECSSASRREQLGTCMNDNPEGHRCVGIHGGHPTLVVWDLLESFHGVY